MLRLYDYLHNNTWFQTKEYGLEEMYATKYQAIACDNILLPIQNKQHDNDNLISIIFYKLLNYHFNKTQ